MSLILRIGWSPNSVGPRLSNSDCTLQWSQRQRRREDAVCTPGTSAFHASRKPAHPHPGFGSKSALMLRVFSGLLVIEDSRTKRITSFHKAEIPDLRERSFIPIDPRDGQQYRNGVV